jgi:hypothetical protein
VLIFAEGISQLPFDAAPLRALPYRLTPDGLPTEPWVAKPALAIRLREAQKAVTGSPIFQLLDGIVAPDVAHLKTDVFRERVQYSSQMKEQLAVARSLGLEAIRAIEKELADLNHVEGGVVIDLLLSYRAVKAWQEMIDLVAKMSSPLAATVLVQEQLALALNRVAGAKRRSAF